MDSRGHERAFASPVVTKIPWFLVLCLGLVFSIAPRIVWATPDTSWLGDALHTVSTRFAGNNHSPGVFYRSTRTGEGVGNEGSFRTSCVFDEPESPRCWIHGSGTNTPAIQESHVNSAMTNLHTCPIPCETRTRRERTSDGVQVGFGYSILVQSVGMMRQLGLPRSKGR